MQQAQQQLQRLYKQEAERPSLQQAQGQAQRL
jgi:hypothetical protein